MAGDGVPVELPEDLRRFLDGSDLERKDSDALGIVTVDDSGWPHVALLSVGEILAISPSTLRMALWPDTTTTANLSRDGRAVLVQVAGGGARYVRLTGHAIDDVEVNGERLATFELTTVGVIVDEVGYADMLCGFRYQLKRPAQVLERWHATLRRLRPADGEGFSPGP